MIPLFIFGILNVIYVGFRAYVAGVRSDADFIHWMVQQPLQHIFLYRALVLSGMLFMTAALILGF